MSRFPWQRDVSRPESITRARTGLTRDLHGRQRRYLTAMLIRTACVVVMAATWSRWPVVALGALVGAVVIPYAAVVVAQAHWRQQRGTRYAVARMPVVQEEPVARVVLEPTLILPPYGMRRGAGAARRLVGRLPSHGTPPHTTAVGVIHVTSVCSWCAVGSRVTISAHLP